MTDYPSKNELDFNNRLIAKFKISRTDSFCDGGFEPISRSALYPDNDRILSLCEGIREELGNDIEPSQLGRFLQAWSKLEGLLMNLARQRRERVVSAREAISILAQEQIVPPDLRERLDAIRQIRNTAVHHPEKIRPGEMVAAIDETSSILASIKGSAGAD